MVEEKAKTEHVPAFVVSAKIEEEVHKLTALHFLDRKFGS